MVLLEFEVPLKRLNDVMDVIVREDSKLQRVYYREDTNSVIIRTVVSKSALQVFLLKLAAVVDVPVEVTIVDEREVGKAIHEAFLVRVDVAEKSYPVAILLLYNISKFYPDTLVVGTSADAPRELIDAVLNLTIGKINLLKAEKVRSSIIEDGLFVQFRTSVANASTNGVVFV